MTRGTRFYAYSFALAAVAAAQPLRVAVVCGDSMSPTLHNRQVCMLDRSYYQRRPIERGDVVVFRHNGATLIKRVLARSGDTICVAGTRVDDDSDDQLVMDWQIPTLKRAQRCANPRLRLKVATRRIPPGFVYVVGDHLNASQDSRHFGPIPVEEIEGRVMNAPPPVPEFAHIASTMDAATNARG